MQVFPHASVFSRENPGPAPVFTVSAGLLASGVPTLPTAELLQSLRHWLTAHPAPADVRAQVAALVAAHELALKAVS